MAAVVQTARSLAGEGRRIRPDDRREERPKAALRERNEIMSKLAVKPQKDAAEIKTEPKSDHKSELKARQNASLRTPNGLGEKAAKNASAALNGVLSDVFALYLKTKNFHWHMSGPHFRDYHLLLDEQADQILAATDVLAERSRKLGGLTLRSIGEISRNQRLLDNDAEYVTPRDMLAELAEDNRNLAGYMRGAHELCAELGDVASTSVLEIFIDEAERRAWFLFETTRTTEG